MIVNILTQAFSGWFCMVGGGGGHKVHTTFFSEMVKATAIKLGTLLLIRPIPIN